MDGKKLGVDVGDVQQPQVAERAKLVELVRRLRVREPAVQARPRRAGEGENPQKIPSVYWFTGDAGSSRSATRSLICCSLSEAEWPKRGIWEQAL